MKVTSIMGMDVSKKTLDCHLFVQQKSLQSVSNDTKGFKVINRWLKKEVKNVNGLLVVMEYTGIYTYQIERFLDQQKIRFVKRPALDIKRSLGMVRGKSDKIDARFISKYGWMRKEELQPMSVLSDTQVELQQLMNHRDKLVADHASYQSKLKELVTQMGKKVNKLMIGSMKQVRRCWLKKLKKPKRQLKNCFA
jgi:transposase